MLSLFFNAFKVEDMGEIKDYPSIEVFLIGPIAFLISGTFIFYKEILASESGRMADIYSLEIGYYLWLTSILFITFSSIYLKIIDRNSNEET